MEFHPIADIFPIMSEKDYLTLVEDIRQNGQHEPITLYNNLILDGRNRYKACLEIGIDPQFKEYTGDDPLAFVLSMNLHRRHLNETQRAIIANKLASLKEGRPKIKNCSNLSSFSQSEAAEILNVSRTIVQSIKTIEQEAPELMPKMELGEMTTHEGLKKVHEKKRTRERANLVEQAEKVLFSDRWHVYQADIYTWQSETQYDFIITDPPYPKEYLPLYDILAKRSLEWLKPSGLLIVMCGQSYLNEIYQILSKYLNYYWTACYLLPGQPTPLRQRQVNTSWKPILIYSLEEYKGKIFGDVFRSDGSDKSYHDWGQSVSGMLSIIGQICLPGQYILDPFCGAGTTGVAALKHGCLFDGIDLELDNVNISKSRLHDQETSG